MFKNSFLSFLFSFMIFKIIGDDLGGGGAAPVVETVAPAIPAVEPVVPAAVEESRLERLERMADEIERAKAVDSLVDEIKTRHADFDGDKVRNYLVELNKTDRAKAESLNNPVGWELLHLQNFAAKDVQNDFFNHGRGGQVVDRSSELLERVQDGLSVADEAVVLAKLL
jgi:hypothetical protein